MKIESKQAIKRLIAREGLIIIFLIVAGSISLKLNSWQEGYTTPRKHSDKQLPTEEEDLSKIPDKELYEASGVPLNERPLSQRVNFLSLAFFLYFCAYPLYILVRFVIWAVKTLSPPRR